MKEFERILAIVEGQDYGIAMKELTELANKNEKLAFQANSIREYIKGMNFGQAKFWLQRLTNEQNT